MPDESRSAAPAFAALLKQSLFGKHEIERTPEAKPPAGTRPAAKFKGKLCVEINGYSLHAATRVHEVAREKLERLIRYVCRPAVAGHRIEPVDDHRVRIKLKNEWSGGVTSVQMSNRDLLLRIAAQIPLPRACSVRYHGAFAPASALRAAIVPSRGELAKQRIKAKAEQASKARCAENAKPESANADQAAPARSSSKLCWAEALRRAFHFDATRCRCGGKRELLAVIMAAATVKRILQHVKLWRDGDDDDVREIMAIRGPPSSLVPPDDLPDPRWDGVDEDLALDWAA